MGLKETVGAGPVAFDTAIFIYFVERHPIYADLVRPIFVSANGNELEIVTSAVTLLEVLIVPYRVGDFPLAQRYEALLTRSRGLRMIEMDRGQLRTAAQIRAIHSVRTPDALQLAAALSARCTTFVTNDRRLPAMPGLRVVQLGEFR